VLCSKRNKGKKISKVGKINHELFFFPLLFVIIHNCARTTDCYYDCARTTDRYYDCARTTDRYDDCARITDCYYDCARTIDCYYDCWDLLYIFLLDFLFIFTLILLHLSVILNINSSTLRYFNCDLKSIHLTQFDDISMICVRTKCHIPRLYIFCIL
jgi:hypothetical protein